MYNPCPLRGPHVDSRNSKTIQNMVYKVHLKYFLEHHVLQEGNNERHLQGHAWQATGRCTDKTMLM